MRVPSRCMIAALLAGGLAVPAHATPFTNGTFSTPVASGSYTEYSGGSTAITGWTVTGDSVDLIGTLWPAPAAAPPGSQSVDLNGLHPGGLTQTFDTIPSAVYTVTFYLAGNPDGNGIPDVVKVKTLNVLSPGDAAPPTFTFDSTVITGEITAADYVLKSFNFIASSSSTTLWFSSGDPDSNIYPLAAFGPVIADVTLSAVPVPEPGSLALLVTALIGFGAIGWRRRL